jgi:hypothetical protein
MMDVRELILVRKVFSVPFVSSLTPTINHEVGITAPFVAHVQDAPRYQAAVLRARNEARQPVVYKEAIAKRPPDVTGVLR